ncbi:glucose-6-phosphate isomerase, partial [candidate division KSB1 bacterium]|nr:glucose-6-phosphate isomerase [candidate division KSB1 bacterium]
GIDIRALLQGARDMAEVCKRKSDVLANPAITYATARYLLYHKHKTIEILAVFEPYFHYLSEWWKQLFGESEGKDGKGLFPAAVVFTTDLHSMGQYIQDGRRDLFETFVVTEQSHHPMVVPDVETDVDGMNFLADMDLAYINHQAYRGTASAHHSGGVPNMTVTLPARDAYSIGQLLYFFEFAVAVSGLLLGVNPFNQPGVNAYKENMFKLLGKK